MPQWDFESSRRLSCIDVAHLGSLSPARATCIFAGGGGVPEGAPPNPVATGEGKDSDNGCRYGAGRVFARRGCGGDHGGLRPGISGGARSRPAMKKPPAASRRRALGRSQVAATPQGIGRGRLRDSAGGDVSREGASDGGAGEVRPSGRGGTRASACPDGDYCGACATPNSACRFRAITGSSPPRVFRSNRGRDGVLKLKTGST